MFAHNLKKLRENKGFSQEGLAEQIHVTRQTISKWERGLSVPDADLLINLADVFEVDVQQLLSKIMEQEDPIDRDILAEKLEQINLQLAKKNRWGRLIVKIVVTIIVIYFVIFILTIIMSSIAYSDYQTNVKTTLERID